VITCTDSGGPLEFVRDGETGRVVTPTPEAVARAVDDLHADKTRARRMGAAGRAAYEEAGIGWEKVVAALTA
jgi:glycosyltransferase involved in cell wall biosynthesis